MGEPATVVEAWRETPVHTAVRLSVPEALAQAHHHPGQYVLLELAPGITSPFAIASTPGERDFELLLGRDALAQLGAEIPGSFSLSAPQGPGFAVERAIGHDVVVFAVGSGMSAVRPLLELIRERRDEFARVVLFAGARSEAEHLYRGFDAPWRDAAIDVRRSVGRPWVQDVFAAAPLKLEHAYAFAAGMDAMIVAVRQTLGDHGLDPSHFLLNH